jgi:hypothetical protein
MGSGISTKPGSTKSILSLAKLVFEGRKTDQRDMKMFLSFVCGAVVMLGFNAMRGASPSHHVYELRMYHVNQGKTEALQARFRDYTDAIFKRHNMKSIGYWVPEDAPASQNLFIYILEHPKPSRGGEELGRIPSRSGMEKGQVGVRGARAIG